MQLTLGDLEMAVMELVWSAGPCDPKGAFAALGPERGITHNTVQSTLKRLWEKGLLEREKDGHAFVYSAAVTRRELTERMIGELVEEVAKDRVHVALEAFVNLAERAGDETLDELERLIALRRRGDE